jgi:hypothetical protein
MFFQLLVTQISVAEQNEKFIISFDQNHIGTDIIRKYTSHYFRSMLSRARKW